MILCVKRTGDDAGVVETIFKVIGGYHALPATASSPPNDFPGCLKAML